MSNINESVTCCNCNSSNLDFIDWEHLLCKDCGMFQPDYYIDKFLFDLKIEPRYSCMNCRYSASYDDDESHRLFCNCDKSFNYDNYVDFDVCGLWEGVEAPEPDTV